MSLKITKPVQLLYHGTVMDYSDLIEQQGLKPISHEKVYLTADINVAYDYAKQRTTDLHTNTMLPVLWVVDAQITMAQIEQTLHAAIRNCLVQ